VRGAVSILHHLDRKVERNRERERETEEENVAIKAAIVLLS